MSRGGGRPNDDGRADGVVEGAERVGVEGAGGGERGGGVPLPGTPLYTVCDDNNVKPTRRRHA